jgi:uncharacterized membrane protein HdeD (DUF308 family)
MRDEGGDPARGPGLNYALALCTFALALAAFLLPELERAPAGGLVGWLLFLAGLVELAFGSILRRHSAGKAALGAGLVTSLAGMLFVINPWIGFFPVANIIILWLLFRGSWLLFMAVRWRGSRTRFWLALIGAVDLMLGIALVIGLQIGALAIALFGPTPEIVARFAWILAASLIVTSISQAGVAYLHGRSGGRSTR